MFSGDSEGVLKAFELQPSSWKLILSLCPTREVGEVRKVLGDSLVEQACDLHEEASALHEIWQQIRQDSDLKLAQIEASKQSMGSSSLPEPPALRERLVQEIQFFVGYLRQKSEEKGHSVGPLLNSPDNREILDYVAHSSLKGDRGLTSRGSSASGGTCSRPMSAVSSRDGRETPLRLHTPTSEEGSQTSVLSDRVEAVNQHVNAYDIDAVVKHLREVLEDECEQYRHDIAFLQSCLDGEHDFISTTVEEEVKPQPTLQELRDLGTKLEHEILETAAKHRSDRAPLSPTTASTQQSPVLKPLLPSLKPRPPTNSSPSVKPLNRASKVKLKAKPLPRNAADCSLCPQDDIPSHYHNHNSRMTRNLSTTNYHYQDSETVHPSSHTTNPSRVNSSQSLASGVHLKGVPSEPSHIHHTSHKGASLKATSSSSSTCTLIRAQYSHLERKIAVGHCS